MSVHPYVHPHIPPEPGVSQKLAQASHGWMDMGTNEHTNVQIPPVFYRTLFPLVSFGALLCSNNSNPPKIPEQGKGTFDHLLPLGDWLQPRIRK